MTALATSSEISYEFQYVNPNDTQYFVDLCWRTYVFTALEENFMEFDTLYCPEGDLYPNMQLLYDYLERMIQKELFPLVDFDQIAYDDWANSEMPERVQEEIWNTEWLFMHDVQTVFDKHQLFYVVDAEDDDFYRRPEDTFYKAHHSPIQEVW